MRAALPKHGPAMKFRILALLALAAVTLGSCELFPESPAKPAMPRQAGAPEHAIHVVPIVQPRPEDLTHPSKAQVAMVPPAKPAPKPNLFDPRQLVGLDQVTVEDTMGKPEGIFQEPPATVWSYKGADCTLDVYFYLDIGSNKLRALSYDAKTEAKADRDGAIRVCVGRIQAENRAKQQ